MPSTNETDLFTIVVLLLSSCGCCSWGRRLGSRKITPRSYCCLKLDVKQDGVECRCAGPDQLADIAFMDAHARVRQTVTENFTHRTACPSDHRRHQFGDGNAGIRTEHGEGCT